ncbi:MAG: hypothetical protein FWG18_00390 [Alphaproteobacteria bacterium]|nr:hypothetical protein [Alphaproteobacteria bacterium]
MNRSESGNMMIEFLLALALAAAMLPFLIRTEVARVARAENVIVANDMALVRAALERYIEDNKASLTQTISRNVTRVKLADLADYGLNVDAIKKSEQFQLRIIKTADRNRRSFLQGVVIMEASELNAMRTREVAEIAGGTAGIAEGNRAIGAFGTWAQNINIWNANFSDNALLDLTGVARSGFDFIRRAASANVADATMQSDISMGGNSIAAARTIASENARFSEFINAGTVNATRLAMENRPNLDGKINVAGDTTINGTLSSDGRGMYADKITLSNLGRFNNLTAREMWAGNLNLSGMSIGTGTGAATLSINRTLDMTGGRISAMFVSVGFAGSVTPRLLVRNRIEDPINPGLYWNMNEGDANLTDLSLANLGLMMQTVIKRESGNTRTESERAMSPIAGNANATVSDFMGALADIESRVRAKYIQLNLE